MARINITAIKADASYVFTEVVGEWNEPTVDTWKRALAEVADLVRNPMGAPVTGPVFFCDVTAEERVLIQRTVESLQGGNHRCWSTGEQRPPWLS